MATQTKDVGGHQADSVRRLLRPRVEEDWAMYKDALRRMYLGQDRSTQSIREEMYNTHGFDASIQQYSRKFRAWGFRKNKTSAQWSDIANNLKRRHLDVNHCEVWARGEMIPRKRLKRELARYDLPTLRLQSRMQCVTKSSEQSLVAMRGDDVLIRIALTPSITYEAPTALPSWTFLQSRTRDLQRLSSTRATGGKGSLLALATRAIDSKGIVENEVVATSLSNLEQPLDTITGEASRVCQIWGCYFPEQTPGNLLRDITLVTRRDTTDAFLISMQYMVYAIANQLDIPGLCFNLEGFLEQFTKRIVLMPDSGNSILGSLIHDPSPTARAVSDRLLMLAITQPNLRLLEVLISQNIDLNRTIADKDGIPTPPVVMTIRKRNSESLHLLLKMGADPSACRERYRNNKRCWCRRYLDEPLSAAIEVRMGTAIDLLIGYNARWNTSHDFVSAIVSRVSIGTVVRILGQVESEYDITGFHASDMPYHYYIGEDGLEGKGWIYLSCALQAAVVLGNVEQVCLLLEHGASPNGVVTGGWSLCRDFRRDFRRWHRCFSCCPRDNDLSDMDKLRGLLSPLATAIITGHDNIAKLLIERGANVNEYSFESVQQYWVNRRPDVRAEDLWSRIGYKLGTSHFEGSRKLTWRELHRQKDKSEHETVWTALQAACMRNNLELATLLTREGATLDPSGGTPPLVWASRHNNIPLVEILLSAGADPNYVTKYGGAYFRDALATAAAGGHYSLLSRLISAGADVNNCVGEDNFMTALEAACASQEYGCATLLLSYGAMVDRPSCYETSQESRKLMSALQHVISNQDEAILELLVSHGVDINQPPSNDTNTLELWFFQAMTRLGLDIITNDLLGGQWIEAMYQRGQYLMVDHIVSQIVSNGGFVTAHAILECTDCQIFDPQAAYLSLIFMVQYCSDPQVFDKHDKVIYQLVTYNERVIGSEGHTVFLKLINLLADLGADVCKPPCQLTLTPLLAAQMSGDHQLVDVLMNHGAEDNVASCQRYARSALRRAAYGGNLAEIKHLVLRGVHVDASLEDGDEPEDHCCHLTICERAYDPTEDEYATTLQSAVLGGHLNVVEYLLQHGADVNAPPSEGACMTALQAACCNESAEILNLLLNWKADVNAPPGPQFGMTALQSAVSFGYMKYVQILVAAGADITAPAADKEDTAIDVAARTGRLDIVAFLLDSYQGDQSISGLCDRAYEIADQAGQNAVMIFLQNYKRQPGT